MLVVKSSESKTISARNDCFISSIFGRMNGTEGKMNESKSWVCSKDGQRMESQANIFFSIRVLFLEEKQKKLNIDNNYYDVLGKHNLNFLAIFPFGNDKKLIVKRKIMVSYAKKEE